MQYFKLGDYNAVCDLCGGTFKASKMRKTWDGYYVCQTDWYPRNPLDFQPRVSEESVPPWTRPRGIDKNLSGGELTASGIIQFYNGVATSPYIPDITASSFVYFSVNYADGRMTPEAQANQRYDHVKANAIAYANAEYEERLKAHLLEARSPLEVIDYTEIDDHILGLRSVELAVEFHSMPSTVKIIITPQFP